MTSEPIRVAVLGYGLAGRVFHCPFVSAVPGLELASIMQRRGDEAAQTYPLARIVRTPEEVFADPRIDLVVVGTPNDTHEAFALAALQAGKHVVVDKPMAPTSKAIAALIAAASSAGKLLFPFHNRRWDGDFLTLSQVIRENRLGRMVKVISHWDRFRPAPRPGTWKESAGDAHGLLQDLGPHLLDQALALFGSPQRLTASVRRDRAHSAIEDAFDIVLEFDRPAAQNAPAAQNTYAGQKASAGQKAPTTSNAPAAQNASAAQNAPATPSLLYACHSTMIAADPAPRFRAHGTSGSFTKCGLDPQEAHLVSDGRHPPQLGSSVPWLSEPEAQWGTLTLAPDPENKPADLVRTEVPTLDGDYRLFYANVRDAIRGEAAPAVTGADAWRVARLIELARDSSRERRTVTVDLASELPS